MGLERILPCTVTDWHPSHLPGGAAVSCRVTYVQSLAEHTRSLRAIWGDGSPFPKAGCDLTVTELVPRHTAPLKKQGGCSGNLQGGSDEVCR